MDTWFLLLWALLSLSPACDWSSFSPSSAVAPRPNQTGLKPRLVGRLNHLRAVWLQSKRSSACVSAAALCVRVCVFSLNLTAVLPPFFLFIFAFKKAALYVVQRRVCVCGCSAPANPPSEQQALPLGVFFFICSSQPEAGQSVVSDTDECCHRLI